MATWSGSGEPGGQAGGAVSGEPATSLLQADPCQGRPDPGPPSRCLRYEVSPTGGHFGAEVTGIDRQAPSPCDPDGLVQGPAGLHVRGASGLGHLAEDRPLNPP